MSKYLRITIVFFGVWFIASLLNGALSGLSIAFLDDGSTRNGVGSIMLSIIFSYVFSAPAVGLVWLLTILFQLGDRVGHDLFQFVLGAALICSIIAAVVFIFTIGTEFSRARYFIGLCVIVSALTSVLSFRKQIKANA
jgi:hypothetical protein